MELCCATPTPGGLSSSALPRLPPPSPRPSLPAASPPSLALALRRCPSLRSGPALRCSHLSRGTASEDKYWTSVKETFESPADRKTETTVKEPLEPVAEGRTEATVEDPVVPLAEGEPERNAPIGEDPEETSSTVVEYEEERGAESPAGGSFDPLNFFNKFDLKLDAGETYPILIYGTGAFVVLWVSSAIVGALDSLPLIPKLLEIVGLGFTAWFSYRYLIFKKNRDELFAQFEDLKEQILGPE